MPCTPISQSYISVISSKLNKNYKHTLSHGKSYFFKGSNLSSFKALANTKFDNYSLSSFY